MSRGLRGLDGRVTLVTGGAVGIGRACCEALAESGATVVVADRDLDASCQAVEELDAAGAHALAVHVEVADPAGVDAVVADVVERFGRLDAAVNNAGVGLSLVPLTEVTDEDWRRVISTNLDGVFYSLRAELRAMGAAGRGVIVNMASIHGCVGAPNQGAYVAAKHGVVGLTKVAALECATTEIRVNAVAPGRILTPLLRASADEEGLARRAAMAPMGRLGEPREVGELVAWLCSDAASYVTGATFAVDGGILAQ